MTGGNESAQRCDIKFYCFIWPEGQTCSLPGKNQLSEEGSGLCAEISDADGVLFLRNSAHTSRRHIGELRVYVRPPYCLIINIVILHVAF